MSSSNKRYYWLKLKEDFFEDDTILWLEEQENGKDYVIFYLKLALKSLNDNGKLIRYVGETLFPYDVPALAKLTGTSPDTVAVAMNTFENIGLISRMDTGEIYMNQLDEMVGSETLAAEKMRRLRAKEKSVKQVGHDSSNNVIGSYEELLEIEIDKDTEREIDSPDSTDVKYDDDSPYLKLAKYLYMKIKENNSKAREPNFQNWADDVRKLVELDGNTVEEVKKVIDWSQADDFWKGNIMSANKLRKQFAKLWGIAGFDKKEYTEQESSLWGEL